MTVLKPRSRMISVRLSEEEYCALRSLCMVTGARSVSDLTRDAMHALIHACRQQDPSGGQADDLRAQVKSLDRKVEQLVAQFGTLRTEAND
ncbi:MAG TPA: hypothetical protein VF786_13990 [Terriglobales bacterium]